MSARQPRAPSQVGQAGERPRGDDAQGRCSTETVDVAQPQPNAAILQRAARRTGVDIRRQDRHAVPPGIADEHGGWPETHSYVRNAIQFSVFVSWHQRNDRVVTLLLGFLYRLDNQG